MIMKAIEFLEKLLQEGWSNDMVQTVNGICYNSIEELAVKYAGAKSVSDGFSGTYNKNATYALLYLKTDELCGLEYFTDKASFVAETDDADERIYFYELS